MYQACALCLLEESNEEYKQNSSDKCYGEKAEKRVGQWGTGGNDFQEQTSAAKRDVTIARAGEEEE